MYLEKFIISIIVLIYFFAGNEDREPCWYLHSNWRPTLHYFWWTVSMFKQYSTSCMRLPAQLTTRDVGRTFRKPYSCFLIIPIHRKSGLLLLGKNYGKRLSMRRTFVVLLWSSCLVSSNFLTWRDKPVIATERMKALTKRRTQIRSVKRQEHFALRKF